MLEVLINLVLNGLLFMYLSITNIAYLTIVQ